MFKLLLLGVFLVSCGVWNSPYPYDEENANTFYSSFDVRPKHLDPARSYSANEASIISQIYEPPLQYHYLKRPFQLQTLTAQNFPVAKYFDQNNNELIGDIPASKVKYSIYTIKIKPNIYYQPHPAFSQRDDNYQLKPIKTKKPKSLFVNPENINKRELTAQDYVYQIKRLAQAKLHSPIYGFMSKHIVGLKELRDKIKKIPIVNNWQDLRNIDFEGAKVIDKYSYQIKIKGKYPQFKLWLTMNFFAPIPWEADEFYSQPSLIAHNINLDWYPIGTGPYMLTVNNPNYQIELQRNPNFHDEFYPSSKEFPSKDVGKKLPFIDNIKLSLEKESIPEWNKFLQGYYDASGISSDNYDYAINQSSTEGSQLTEQMKAKGIYLKTTIAPTIFYLGFNMHDEVVGGLSEKNRKLRLAIAIAYDYEEYISIFLNGRGIAAQGPIAPGIFGFVEGKDGLNPYIYHWQQGKAKKKDLKHAHQLLAQAGYPNGIDPKTGQSLKLYLDSLDSGSGGKAIYDWKKKQFAKLNIQLVIRNSDYNRFQDKMLQGKAQLFEWGWNADYPDPENFLFLLYGKNKKAGFNGENAANYQNGEFDKLFIKMQAMDNTAERHKIIKQMVSIARKDSPWLWGFHPKVFGLYHGWVKNKIPNVIANNTMKYLRIDTNLRAQLRNKWNQPMVWPFILIVLGLSVLLWITFKIYRNSLNMSIKQKIALKNDN